MTDLPRTSQLRARRAPGPTARVGPNAGSVPCVILGSGNIGTDLMYKVQRSEILELSALVGIDPASEGLSRAKAQGLATSSEGINWILANCEPGTIVFEATSARVHMKNAPLLRDAGLQSIDLTPSRLGPGVVPTVNLHQHIQSADISLISCGAQATIPMVAAVRRVAAVEYAEIVATISSRSAGPGTRQNIDEFTATTASGLEEVGGAERGKAIIVLNPADPPILMRNTVYCSIPEDADLERLNESVVDAARQVASYVPGYRLRTDPVVDLGRIAIFIEVEGAGDYLPAYAGNLDIMTAAAVRVAEDLAGSLHLQGQTVKS